MSRKFIQRTDEEWEELLEKVNIALGFELYPWQKEFIMLKPVKTPRERCSGHTTAFILRELLNLEGPLERSFRVHDGIAYTSGFLCDAYYSRFYAHSGYPHFVIEIDDKLQAAGIKTCFTKNDSSSMELVDFIEKLFEVKLNDCQKEYVTKAYESIKNAQIIFPRGRTKNCESLTIASLWYMDLKEKGYL